MNDLKRRSTQCKENVEPIKSRGEPGEFAGLAFKRLGVDVNTFSSRVSEITSRFEKQSQERLQLPEPMKLASPAAKVTRPKTELEQHQADLASIAEDVERLYSQIHDLKRQLIIKDCEIVALKEELAQQVVTNPPPQTSSSTSSTPTLAASDEVRALKRLVFEEQSKNMEIANKLKQVTEKAVILTRQLHETELREQEASRELSVRRKQLANAADKYRQIKSGKTEPSEWQTKYTDLLNELDYQKTYFQEEFENLYSKTIEEYEAAMKSEIQRVQTECRAEKDKYRKSNEELHARIQMNLFFGLIVLFISVTLYSLTR